MVGYIVNVALLLADHAPPDTVACAASGPGMGNETGFQRAGDLELEDAEVEPDETLPGPATLWGILSSEISPPKAVTCGSINVPESELPHKEAIINIWVAAGYDCQLPEEYYTISPAMTSTKLINDEESMQNHQSPDPPYGPYIVKRSPGKGQGVFAARDVSKGERILVDTPFFVVPRPYDKHKVLSEFELMPLARRQQYMQLYCPDRFDDLYMTDVMRIFEANCFNIGDKAAMFLTATRFNHSCLPNIYYSWSEKRNEIVFHSMINILDGEEMTICYGYPFLTCLERHSELHIYNFWCLCPACQIETAFGRASQSRRLEMRALNEQIIMFQNDLNEALLIYGLRDPLTAVLRLIEVIKEEGLHGELMMPYRSAADYLKGRGNFEEALKFAHLELKEEVVCFGDDSEVVFETIEYIEELESVLERAKGEEVHDDEDDAEQIGLKIEKRAPVEGPTVPDADIQEPDHEPETELGEENPKDPTEDMQALEMQPHPEPEERDRATDHEAECNEVGASDKQQNEEP